MSDCVLWTGTVDKDGYPTRTRLGYRYRLVYEEHKGPIPLGMEIDHVCHSTDPSCPGGTNCLHRRCLNPDHLEAVTHAENTRRSAPARKTHCVRGHEFTPENTRKPRPGYGQRQCRACQAAATKRYKQRKKERRAQ